jgi:hypothetical protein
VWLGILWVGMIAGFGVDIPRYLRENPPSPEVVHVHAMVFSTWLLLLTAQVLLVLRDRVSWHRKLGLFAAGWAWDWWNRRLVRSFVVGSVALAGGRVCSRALVLLGSVEGAHDRVVVGVGEAFRLSKIVGAAGQIYFQCRATYPFLQLAWPYSKFISFTLDYGMCCGLLV